MAIEQFFGRIVDMVRRTDGDELVANAAIAATTIYVGDTADFDETGGTVEINDVRYPYDSLDHDAATLHLTAGLSVAAVIGDRVDVVDEELDEKVVEYVANVLLEDQDPGDEPIEVTVNHGLVNYLAEQVRGGFAESVTLIRDGDDDLVIWQVDGKLVTDLALEEVAVDLGGSLDTVAADLAELNDVTLPALQADLATLDGLFPITSTNISDSAITTPKIATNAVSADKIVANAISADKLAANSVSADKIVANAVTSDKIAANAITAAKIAATAIDGMSIRGAELITAYDGIGGSGWALSFTGLVGPSFTTQIGNTGAAVFASVSTSGGVTAGGAVHGDALYCDTIDTTANAANVYMGAAGKLQKSTSSLRYKKNVAAADLDVETLLALQPKSYQSRNADDGSGRFVGFIAEEAHDLGLTQFVVYDEDGQPDGFAYPMFTAALQAVCQAQQQQIDALTARLDAAGL